MDHTQGAAMSRSIFDPTGDETERSGSRNLGPDAGNLSHMPPDVVDGEVSEEEETEQTQINDLDSDENLHPVALTEDEAAAHLLELVDETEEENTEEEP
jgi:hypothetical protein